MPESNVFMVLYFTGDEVKIAGVYSSVVDADDRLEEVADKFDLDDESIWMEEYVMDKDIEA